MVDVRKVGPPAGIAFIVIALAAAIGVWIKYQSSPNVLNDRDPKLTENTHPLPQLSQSPFRNTSSEAEYVGAAACLDCHQTAHDSYRETSHSQALGDVDPSAEPPDAEVVHQAAGRAYRIYRAEGKLWHQESLVNGEEEFVVADVPMALTIGSGHHSRSYLVEFDGFLYESPLTWYAAKNAWDLSPGYDELTHLSFSRIVDEGCVSCHAGQVASTPERPLQLSLKEQKIGCESCHGPGSLHVAAREENPPNETPDLTIVNPRQLSRRLQESICARCHLRGAATVSVRGRSLGDFRPGLPLTDFRIDYRVDDPDSSMTVTGHFEQMHQSRCYTESAELNCITCHNPHDKPSQSEQLAYYRGKCLSCHEATGGCGLDEKTRHAQNPEDDCVSCHMPRADTEIPHFAFTHHRIGLNHRKEYRETSRDGLELKPIGDISRLPALEQQRCLGLGYLESSDLSRSQEHREQAFRLLTRVYNAGIRDGDVLAGLARLHRERDSQLAVPLAYQAQSQAGISSGPRINSLIVLGEELLDAGSFAEAAEIYEQLTVLRRLDVDWESLGICRGRTGDHQGAIDALEKALAIRRDRPNLHRMLSEAYERIGNSEKAKHHQSVYEKLTRVMKRGSR